MVNLVNNSSVSFKMKEQLFLFFLLLKNIVCQNSMRAID